MDEVRQDMKLFGVRKADSKDLDTWGVYALSCPLK